MCGVIVEYAGRRSLPGYRHNYLKFYQLPNSNLFTHRMLFFSREATSEIYDPRVYFLIIYFQIYFAIFPYLFICIFYFQIYIIKTQKYLAEFYLVLFASINLLEFYLINLTIFGTVTRKGLTTPLTRRVARICYLCACAIYVVLLGSPTGSITLVSYLREIPTAAMLHHPFLFGEIPT